VPVSFFRIVAGAALLATLAGTASADCVVRGGVSIYLAGFTLTSDGHAWVENNNAIVTCPAFTSGTHQITGSDFVISATKTLDTSGMLKIYDWVTTLTVTDG
jgi:hypothetical protein